VGEGRGGCRRARRGGRVGRRRETERRDFQEAAERVTQGTCTGTGSRACKQRTAKCRPTCTPRSRSLGTTYTRRPSSFVRPLTSHPHHALRRPLSLPLKASRASHCRTAPVAPSYVLYGATRRRRPRVRALWHLHARRRTVPRNSLSARPCPRTVPASTTSTRTSLYPTGRGGRGKSGRDSTASCSKQSDARGPAFMLHFRVGHRRLQVAALPVLRQGLAYLVECDSCCLRFCARLLDGQAFPCDVCHDEASDHLVKVSPRGALSVLRALCFSQSCAGLFFTSAASLGIDLAWTVCSGRLA